MTRSTGRKDVHKKVVDHPSKKKLLRDVNERFLALRAERDKARDLLWVGMLATHFDNIELEIAASMGLMCVNDWNLLRAVGR